MFFDINVACFILLEQKVFVHSDGVLWRRYTNNMDTREKYQRKTKDHNRNLSNISWNCQRSGILSFTKSYPSRLEGIQFALIFNCCISHLCITQFTNVSFNFSLITYCLALMAKWKLEILVWQLPWQIPTVLLYTEQKEEEHHHIWVLNRYIDSQLLEFTRSKLYWQ